MNIPTFAQRIANNFRRNVAPIPQEWGIASSNLPNCSTEQLQAAMTALHRWIENIYLAAVQSPADFGLPMALDVPPRTGSRYSAAVKAVEAIPRLIYAIGICGEPAKEEPGACLKVGAACFTRYCHAAKIYKVEGIVSGLTLHGLEITPPFREWSAQNASTISVRFPAAPEVAYALPVFARACCLVAKDELRPPIEFYRVDLRILTDYPGKPSPVPIRLGDALLALDEAQAQILSDFDRLVVGLGFRPEIKCSGLARGEWRGSYHSSRFGKTLFGFIVEECQLNLRIMIDQIQPILPHLQKCPLDFRELFYASCNCSGCNQCQDGPLCIEQDGAPRKLCHYAYFEIPSFSPEHVQAMRMLLEVQAGILKERQKARK